MRQFLVLFAFVICSITTTSAQPPNGTIAPDFTLQDLNGNTHNLYDILDQGKSVVVDVFATWCPPCWNYNNTNTLKNIYNTYGPMGTGEVEVFKLEHSASTNEACIYGPAGCIGGTQGDWVTGNPIPIVHLTSGNGGSFVADYNINYQPIIMKICPNKKIYTVGTASNSTWVNWITSCDLDASATTTDAVCFGDGSGVDLDVTGGLGTATYSWSNGATTQDLVNIPAGNYSCTVTEGQGHSIEVGPYTVAGATSVLNVNINSISNVLCNGQSNGAVDLDVFGGSGPYIYLWSNGAFSQDLTNVTAGTYSCVVTDALGCEETIMATVDEPAMLVITTSETDANCGGSDGSIDIVVSGGTSPFMYNIGGGPTTNTLFPNLPAGTYTVTVTDANGCMTSSSATINDIPGPTADAGAGLTIDCSIASVQLNGIVTNTGSNFTISWTTATGNILSGASGLSPTVDQPGTYNLSILNNDTGCSAQDQVVVTGDVTVPNINFDPVTLITCIQNSTTLSATATGGLSFAFDWKDAAGVIIQSGMGTSTSVTVTQPGSYTLTAANLANGCETIETILVDSDTTLPLADAGANQTLDCNTTSVTLDGSASIGSNIDYTWLDDSGAEIGTNVSVSVSNPGNYTLVVTNDPSGCTASSSVSVLEDIQSPVADAGMNQTIDCNVTSVTLGGNSSSGSNFVYQWTDQNNTVLGSNSTLIVSSTGVYELEVTNTDNGCVSTSSVVVSMDTNLPIADAGPSMTLTCITTSVTLGGNSSSGGNFSHSWLNANGVEIGNEEFFTATTPGTYTLIVTNLSNGCYSEDMTDVGVDMNIPMADAGPAGQIDCINSEVILNGSGSSTGTNIEYSWSNESGTVISTDLNTTVSTAGIYTLTVLNLPTGCEATSSVEVTASSDFPIATVTVFGMITCSSPAVDVSSDGSSSGNNFSYAWIDEDGNVFSTFSVITVLEASTFTFVVTDSNNGCEASTTVVVSENFDDPIADIATPDAFDCNTNIVTIDGSASSGSNLSFAWFDVLGNALGTGATVDVTEPGLYYLNIEDGDNGCTATESVAVQELSEVSLTASTVAVSCFGDSDGTATVVANGGEGPYQYLWSNGQTSPTVVGLEAGPQDVTATDQNGCEAIITVVITEPDALTLTIDVTDETGEGLNDGTASGFPVGGTGGYNFLWSIGSAASVIDNLPPGSYQLTVTDANGCSVVQSSNIGSFDCDLAVSMTATNITCAGDDDGTISLTVLQGGAVSFDWTGIPNTGPNVDELAAGVYGYTVTDANNCTVEGQAEILEPNPISGSISNILNIDCSGGSMGGQATAQATGGTGNLSFLWSNGESSATATQLPAGINTVIITDSNGCSIELPVSITSDDTTPPVAMGQNVNLQLDASGNASLFSSQVNNGSTDNCGIASFELSQSIFTCDDIGTHDVTFTVIDMSGNMNSTVVQVVVDDLLAPFFIAAPSITTNSCAPVEYDIPTASDNCGMANVTLKEGLPSGSIFPLGVSTVTYEASDFWNNSTTISFTVTVTFDLEISASSTDVLCFGEENGTAQVFPVGGTPGYQYAWSNGQETATANNLAPGDYSATVTDNTGCESEVTVTIIDAPEILLTLDNLTNASNGNNDGSIDISVSGGFAPYTYAWALNGAFYSNDEDLTDLAPGNYSVEVQDANGCEFDQFGFNIENIVGVENSIYSEYINLSPNPTRDQINLAIQLPSRTEVRLEIIALNGAILEVLDLGKVQELRREVALDNYASGVYFFKFVLEEDVFVEKVVLQK